MIVTTFSECRTYRYTLRRTFGNLFKIHLDRYVNFICLNPSTADEHKDDNTIRKCMKFASSWGYDAMIVTNLFAYRSTDPEAMKKVAEPIGPENDRYIEATAQNASMVVAAWSQHGSHLGRSTAVRKLLGDLPIHYLRMGNKEPWHPLYLPDSTQPIEWSNNAETIRES